MQRQLAPDKISNKLLRLAAPEISQALVNFFNFSMESNTFTNDWKIAKIFPLFKNGERSDPSNDRPISVLLTISRVFKRLVYEQMYAYFIGNKLIEPHQSGFRSLHSTVTAYLDMTD